MKYILAISGAYCGIILETEMSPEACEFWERGELSVVLLYSFLFFTLF